MADFGVRLDAGTAYTGAIITRSYDSLLVKVTAHGSDKKEACVRMDRALQEFRIRGVKTNIPFLLNVIRHPDFIAGAASTTFIDQTPELFRLPVQRDRATKVLLYLADVIVNSRPDVKDKIDPKHKMPEAVVPAYNRRVAPPPGLRQKLQELGPEPFCKWVRGQRKLFITGWQVVSARAQLDMRERVFHSFAHVRQGCGRCVPEV